MTFLLLNIKIMATKIAERNIEIFERMFQWLECGGILCETLK